MPTLDEVLAACGKMTEEERVADCEAGLRETARLEALAAAEAARQEAQDADQYDQEYRCSEVSVEITPEDAIIFVCQDMKELLLSKNKSYGGAAFKDVTLAGMHVSAEKAILVRMSDKIRRLQDGEEYGSENTVEDLIGYGLLLQAVRLYKTQRGEK
jgi:hypothetical protein